LKTRGMQMEGWVSASKLRLKLLDILIEISLKVLLILLISFVKSISIFLFVSIIY